MDPEGDPFSLPDVSVQRMATGSLGFLRFGAWDFFYGQTRADRARKIPGAEGLGLRVYCTHTAKSLRKQALIQP